VDAAKPGPCNPTTSTTTTGSPARGVAKATLYHRLEEALTHPLPRQKETTTIVPKKYSYPPRAPRPFTAELAKYSFDKLMNERSPLRKVVKRSKSTPPE